jgi:hypothetical protein
MAGTGVFVGRAAELSRLESALADRARLVLVFPAIPGSADGWRLGALPAL